MCSLRMLKYFDQEICIFFYGYTVMIYRDGVQLYRLFSEGGKCVNGGNSGTRNWELESDGRLKIKNTRTLDTRTLEEGA